MRHRVDGAPNEGDIHMVGERGERREEARAGEDEDEGGDGGDDGGAVGEGDDEPRGKAVLKHIEDAHHEDSWGNDG